MEEQNNEIKNLEQLVREMQGQINSLLEEWASVAYAAYKANEMRVTINLKLRLEGDGGNNNVAVKSGISFLVEKITDEREGEIRLGQEKLL